MKYREEKLKNGLRVVLAPLRTTSAVTVLALVKVGSRFEGKNLEGAAHFIEHLMFKGTERRPNTAQISQELDSIGAEYNAYTSKDHTGYYIKAKVDCLELALDMLADMLFHSKFEEQEINRERGVIIEEINMYEDNPMMHAPSLFDEVLYGEAKPLGHNIAGTRLSITKMSRADLLKFRNRFYAPGNMILGIGGGFRNGRALKSAAKYFVDRTKTAKIEKIGRTANYSPSQIQVKFKEGEQMQICLGFPAINIYDKQLYALGILNVILGGNMSSRLFLSVRERQGLCYFIRSSTDNYEDAGSLMIQAGLQKSRLDKAMKVILEELRSLKDKGIGADELKKAKDYIEGRTTLDLEDSSNVIEELVSTRLFYGKVITPKDRLKKIKAVSLGEVNSVARRIIKQGSLKLALVGPVRDIKKLKAMIQF